MRIRLVSAVVPSCVCALPGMASSQDFEAGVTATDPASMRPIAYGILGRLN